jgi:tetratricopeptide (TPR) repeat protein
MKYLSIAALAFSSASSFASTADEAFKAGQFVQAATTARSDCLAQIEQMKTRRAPAEELSALKQQASDACALAARATLTVAAYQATNRTQAEKLISVAIADANKALEQTPNHVEATLQGAIALGYSAKLQQSPGIAKEAKKQMDLALQLAPNNGFATIALAGWNGESVADIGSFLAGTVLGAKKETAIKYYEQSLKLDPASPSFPVFYAFNLYRLDDKKYAARVTQLLGMAMTLKARDGFEAMNITHAKDVLSALKSGDSKRATMLIKHYQPFGAILKK